MNALALWFDHGRRFNLTYSTPPGRNDKDSYIIKLHHKNEGPHSDLATKIVFIPSLRILGTCIIKRKKAVSLFRKLRQTNTQTGKLQFTPVKNIISVRH